VKSFEQQFEEMADLVIKLVWGYTIFRAMFTKNGADCETRAMHPELFLTLDECLVSGFCIKAAILFETHEKQLSLCNLIRATESLKPDLAKKLAEKVTASEKAIAALEVIRNQVVAHRSFKKNTQDVYDEAKAQVGMMEQVSDLAKSIVLELASVVGEERRATLERQQFSKENLQIVADDAAKIVRALG
jgi:hypothetical protein